MSIEDFTTEIQFKADSYRVDSRKHLKPSAFMAVAQEVANRNATSLGMGYDDLLKKGITWIVSRIKVEYVGQPVMNQELTMETWHKGMRGPFSARDILVRDAESGGILIRCTTSWLLIDLKERSLVRMENVIGEILSATATMKDAIPEPCGHIRNNKALDTVCTRRVVYSEIDYNGHVNNSRYAEWIMDAMEPEVTLNHDVASFSITFNHEALLGDNFTLFRREISPLRYYVEGRDSGNSLFFQSEISFR